MKKPYYLIQKNDEKAKCWSFAACERDISIIAMNKSPIFFPVIFIRMLLTYGKPSGVILRYLNDYHSLAKTGARFIAEIALILLLALFRVKLFWICHNVDKETVTHYPLISKIRRLIFSYYAYKILVTDDLLVKHFGSYFPSAVHKCEAIGFGLPMDKSQCNQSSEQKAQEFIESHALACSTLKTQELLVTFCAGSPENDKYLHFDYLSWLLENTQYSKFKIIAIVAGNFKESERGLKLKKEYLKNENILLFDEYTEFSESFIKNYVDFYWRVYSDYSVPYTVYEALKHTKPIMTLDHGFLPELIFNKNLGPVVSSLNQISDFDQALSFIKSHKYDATIAEFRASVSWYKLADSILRHI